MIIPPLVCISNIGGIIFSSVIDKIPHKLYYFYIKVLQIRGEILIEQLEGLHEIINYKEENIIKIFYNSQHEDYPTHWHKDIEIIIDKYLKQENTFAIKQKI